MEPEETSIVPRGYLSLDVDKQAAVATVPDSNGSISSGRRDATSFRRVFRSDHRAFVTEYLHLFASHHVANDGFLVSCRDQSHRVRREIDAMDVLVLAVLEGHSERRCVPDKHTTCPGCNPFPIVGYCDTVDKPCLYRCQLLPVVDSPHSNLLVVTAYDILAICRERHRPYSATGVYFDGLGTLLSNCQHKCNSVSQVRTGQRWGHLERGGGSQSVVCILFASCTLFLADIDQYSRRTALCLVPSTESFLPPMHHQAFAPSRATLRNPIYALNLRRHRPFTRSRIKASDKISTSQVPLHIPAHGGTVFGLCVLVPSSRRRSLQECHVVNPVKLHILFAPTLLLVDAPRTSETAIVAKGGVPDLPQ